MRLWQSNKINRFIKYIFLCKYNNIGLIIQSYIKYIILELRQEPNLQIRLKHLSKQKDQFALSSYEIKQNNPQTAALFRNDQYSDFHIWQLSRTFQNQKRQMLSKICSWKKKKKQCMWLWRHNTRKNSQFESDKCCQKYWLKTKEKVHVVWRHTRKTQHFKKAFSPIENTS